jgi:hypothetical protein
LSALLSVDEQADCPDLQAFADAFGVGTLTRFAWGIGTHVGDLSV